MIDIIIPVYNSHDTIIQTLLSIANQSIKDNITVYLVDDNSYVDYTQEIKLFKGRLKIKQIHLKENRGPGYARQYCVERSNGDFIMFLDGDDLLYNSISMELLYKEITKGFDMVHSTILEEHDDVKLLYSNFQNSLHGKLYRREFIVKNDIKFNDTRYHEDNAYNRLFLLAQPKLSKIDDIAYIYKNNPNSVTKKDKDYEFQHFLDFINNRLWVFECAEERGFDKKLIAELILDTHMTMFTQYNMYYYRDDVQTIARLCVPLYKKLLQYKRYITQDKENEVYHSYTENYIPFISVAEFSKYIINYMED